MFKKRFLVTSRFLWIIALLVTACGPRPSAPADRTTTSQATSPASITAASAEPASVPSAPLQPTLSAELTPLEIESLEGQATAQAQSMLTLIPLLQAKGVNVSKQGAYYKLDDHTITVKDPYSRDLDNIEGFYLSNFVMRATLSWDKPQASMVDLDNSGCGFSFHLNTDGGYELKIRIDGSAALHRIEYVTQYTYKAYSLRDEPYRSQFISQGGENIILVVNQNLVTFLADDRIIFQVEDEQFTSEIYGKGLIAYLIENSKLGGEITCNWTAVELWEINPVSAVDVLTQEATLVPTPPLEAEDYYNQGVTLYRKGDYSQAIVAFTKAINLSPTVYVSYFSRGILHYVRGDYPAALKDFNKTIELMPDLAVAYYRRGQVYEKIGDEEKSNADFEKAEELGYIP